MSKIKSNRRRGLSHHHHSSSSTNDTEKVPLQRKPFAGEYCRYVLSPKLASEKFTDVALLLDALNKKFGTNISISYPGVQKTLKHLIFKGHDFGAIYAHLQAMWPTLSVPSKLPSKFKPFPNDNFDSVIGWHPGLASKKFRDIQELLNWLNKNFKTNISTDHPGIKEVLGCLISQGCEFGDICTIVVDTWPRTRKQKKEWARIWGGERMNLWEDFLVFRDRGEGYERSRRKSLRDDNTIVDPDLIKPRRIWDLYAHRVIPFHFSLVDTDHYKDPIKRKGKTIMPYAKPEREELSERQSSVPPRLNGRFRPVENNCKGYRYHAVSHSWTKDMSGVDSPVNAHEWPVPLPHGVTLEAVRTELLNLGAQYVWLDIVCLRQEFKLSSESYCEALRYEWKIDLPTIGWIYSVGSECNMGVIRYFNGLGKVFKNRGWRDEKHWSQRAWTVQEIGGDYIDAGVPEGVKDVLEETDEDGIKLRDYLERREMRSAGICLHRAVPIMKERYSQDDVDKVLGLSALLQCDPQIAYLKDEAPENAWTRLIKQSNQFVITDLLLHCLLPGENGCYWRPSWNQLMDGTRMVEEGNLDWMDKSDAVCKEYIESLKVDEAGCLNCTMLLIEGCQVSAPDDLALTLLMKATRGDKKYEWSMTNRGAQDITPGEYTLAGGGKTWVLCRTVLRRKRRYGKLEKVSVLKAPGWDHTDFWDLKSQSTRKKIAFC